MTDNEILLALQHCKRHACAQCPLKEECGERGIGVLFSAAIALISRQKEEMSRNLCTEETAQEEEIVKGFIEVHTVNGDTRFINVRNIVEISESTVYLRVESIATHTVKFMEYKCTESYGEIREKIRRAMG